MLAILAAACGPADADPPLPPDQAELERIVLPYDDPTRPTPEVGDTPGADHRALSTWVWIGPSRGADAPKRPLVLLLHGMNGHPEKFEALAQDLALAGLVVAAPAFPVSNAEVEGSEVYKLGDFLEQVPDAGFVLDRLLEDVAHVGSPLYGRFHPGRILGMGHSMGGATLLGRTRFGDGDPRFAAQIYVSAALQLLAMLEADGQQLEPRGPRTLVAQGLLDELVPPGFGDQLYDAIDPPKWYLGIAGAEHSEPVESTEVPAIPEREALQRAVLAMAAAVTADDDTVIDEELAALAAEGHTVR